MENIFEPNDTFDFSKLSLGQPQVIQSSNYFTKLLFENKDFFIQLPKCKTKQGIIQNEKKMHTDLLYESFNQTELSEWVETLEQTCQKLIYNKKNMWFMDNIELTDIESAFNNLIKYQKNGKQMLIRCYINRPQAIKLSPLCVVYDENENRLSITDITYDKDIIPLVKLEGIRFSSRSFQIELNLVQIMVLKEQDKQCLIKIKTNNSQQQDIDNNYLINNENKNNDDINNDTNDINSDNNSDNDNYIKIDSSKDFNFENDLENISINNTTEQNFNLINNKENDLGTTSINDNNYLKGGEYKNEKNNDILNNITKNTNIENIILENTNDNNYNEDCLEIVDFDLNKITETIKLKKPNEIYYEIYRTAREKAKLAKKLAIEAFLEAKNIKTKYMLDDLDESDDEISIMEKM